MDKEPLWELKKLSRFFEVGTTSWPRNSKSCGGKCIQMIFTFFHKTPGFDVKLYCPSRSINWLF